MILKLIATLHIAHMQVPNIILVKKHIQSKTVTAFPSNDSFVLIFQLF